jgi:hypothetical protein
MKKSMPKKPKGDSTRAKLKVKVKYAPAPDVGDRVSRAIDILLAAAAKNTVLPKEGGIAPKVPPKETSSEIAEDKEQ